MAENENFENVNNKIRFDEKAFLRKARFISILRITLISLGVTIGIFVLFFVIPEIMLQNQENRIDSIYPELIKFSEPNTFVLPGESYNVRLFGRQKKYYLLRLIGNKPYPAGAITVDFDVWGGEQIKGNQTFSLPDETKEYLIPYAVPKLKFYHPAANYEKIIRDFNILKNIPKDYYVEIALSFRKPLTFDEMKTIMPGDLKLMWGTVCVFSEKDYAKNRYLSERLVGNPYLDKTNGEKQLLKELERLSSIPSHHAKNLKKTVSYLKENGIKYYGVVVVGNPDTLAKLSSNPMIRAAVLGVVTRPE